MNAVVLKSQKSNRNGKAGFCAPGDENAITREPGCLSQAGGHRPTFRTSSGFFEFSPSYRAQGKLSRLVLSKGLAMCLLFNVFVFISKDK